MNNDCENMSFPISVIIPVYNSSEYVARSIHSVCTQTISEKIQLVIVDDCSTDDTLAVIENILAKNNYLGEVKIVCHSHNQGVAIARKTGIDNADGDYLLFCDSDDSQEIDMCERMLKEAIKGNHDVVICDYVMTDGIKKTFYGHSYVVGEDYIKNLSMAKFDSSLCNKLVRRNIYRHEKFIFPELPFAEDGVFCVQIGLLSNSIGYVPERLYNYYQRPTSLTRQYTRSGFRTRFEQHIVNHELFEHILSIYGLSDKYKEELILHRYKIKNSLKHYLNQPEFKQLWKQTYPRLGMELFQSRYVPILSILVYYFNCVRAFSFL